MAVPYHIPHSTLADPGTPKGDDGMPGLGTDGDRVNNWRINIVRVMVPGIDMQMEDMRFFHASMNQSDANRIPNVSF